MNVIFIMIQQLCVFEPQMALSLFPAQEFLQGGVFLST